MSAVDIEEKTQASNKDKGDKKLVNHKIAAGAFALFAVLSIGYTIYNRKQSKQDIQDQINATIQSTPNASLLNVYLQDETLVRIETSKFTNLQLALLTLAFFLVIFLVKRVIRLRELEEYGLYASGQTQQISTDEYEEQMEEHTERELEKLQRSQEFQNYQREKVRWQNIEEEEERKNQNRQSLDTNLNNLIDTMDDSDYIENEFEKIDQLHDRVKQRIVGNQVPPQSQQQQQVNHRESTAPATNRLSQTSRRSLR